MTANKISPQTRSPTRTRLTLAFVVVLGVCVVLAAFVGVSWRWIHRDLQAITEIELPRLEAAMEMEINTLGTGLAVTQYLHDHQDEHLQRIDKDRMDFEQALATYRRLAPPGSVESEFADLAQQLYGRSCEVGDELIATDRRILIELEAVGERLRLIDDLLDEKLQPAAVAEGSAGYEKLRLLMDLEIDVNEMSRRFNAYLTTADEAVLSESLAGDEQEFRQDLATLQTMPLSQQEQGWAQELERVFEEVVAAHQAIHQDKQLLDRGVEEFGRLRIALDDLLDDVIQQRAVQDIQTASTAAVRRMRAFTLTAMALTAAALLLLLPILTLTRKVAKTERQLRESQTRLEALFDQTFQFIGLLKPDGTLLEANQGPLAFGKVTRSEAIGRPLWQMSGWNYSCEAQDRLEVAVAEAATGAFVRYQVDLPNADGEMRTFDFSLKPMVDEAGQVILLIAEGRDITERKQAEEELIESRERFRQLAENIGEVFWLTDWAKRKLLYVSPAYETIFGQSCASLYEDRHGWADHIHPDDKLRTIEAFRQKAELGQYCEEEYRINHPQRGIRWIRDRAFPVRDEAGEVHRIVGLAEDITARKRAEEQTRQLQADLAHMSRLSSMGEMATGLAHELNQPLTVITNYAQGCVRRLKSSAISEDELENILSRIATQARRSGSIIRGLESLVRKSKCAADRDRHQPEHYGSG